MGQPIQIIEANTESNLDAIFAAHVQPRAGALLVVDDPLLGAMPRSMHSSGRSPDLVGLRGATSASRSAGPTIMQTCPFKRRNWLVWHPM